MAPQAVTARLVRTGAVILPAGTLEFRAAHLPLGCDTLILECLADDLSARTGMCRAPAIEYGVHARGDEARPGTAALSRKTLHRAINELIAAWEDGAGARRILILTAHAAEAHLEALSTVRARGIVQVVDIFSLDFSSLLGLPGGPMHGGELDTSLVWYLYPLMISDQEAARRLGASAEKGRVLYDFLTEEITSRLLLPIDLEEG